MKRIWKTIQLIIGRWWHDTGRYVAVVLLAYATIMAAIVLLGYITKPLAPDWDVVSRGVVAIGAPVVLFALWLCCKLLVAVIRDGVRKVRAVWDETAGLN